MELGRKTSTPGHGLDRDGKTKRELNGGWNLKLPKGPRFAGGERG